jgi:hypothetical protein
LAGRCGWWIDKTVHPSPENLNFSCATIANNQQPNQSQVSLLIFHKFIDNHGVFFLSFTGSIWGSFATDGAGHGSCSRQ